MPASSTVSAEGVAGGVGDSEERRRGGALRAGREIDRLELDARAVGSRWSWTRRPAWSPGGVRRHRLAEHHQAAVVEPEVVAGLLAGGGGLLRLRQRRLEPVDVLLQACGLVALGADHEQPEGRDHADRRPGRGGWSARSASWRRRRSRDEGVGVLASLLRSAARLTASAGRAAAARRRPGSGPPRSPSIPMPSARRSRAALVASVLALTCTASKAATMPNLEMKSRVAQSSEAPPEPRFSR